MSGRRLEALAGLPVLPVNETALKLAEQVLRRRILPQKAGF